MAKKKVKHGILHVKRVVGHEGKTCHTCLVDLAGKPADLILYDASYKYAHATESELMCPKCADKELARQNTVRECAAEKGKDNFTALDNDLNTCAQKKLRKESHEED